MPSGGDGKVYKQNHLVHNMECSCQTGSVSVGQFDEKKSLFQMLWGENGNNPINIRKITCNR